MSAFGQLSGLIWLLRLQANKAHVELNTKNVYKADGYAVKEMLKVTSLLFGAMKTTEAALGVRNEEDNVKVKFNIPSQVRKIPWGLTSCGRFKSSLVNSLRVSGGLAGASCLCRIVCLQTARGQSDLGVDALSRGLLCVATLDVGS